MSYEVKQVECILTEEQFIDKMTECKLLRRFRSSLRLKKLKDAGLIPLFNNNKKLSILARIVGSLLTDGSINVYHKKQILYYVSI